jgi:hypothetical protein
VLFVEKKSKNNVAFRVYFDKIVLLVAVNVGMDCNINDGTLSVFFCNENPIYVINVLSYAEYLPFPLVTVVPEVHQGA